MAEGSSTVNLKILSPSSEVDGALSLSDVPASTTIGELRSRIQNALPTKPAPERMRLIYRGRVVANDGDTLEHVFGPENLRENKDQSLHLVLRDMGPSGSIASLPTARTPAGLLNPNPLHQAPPHAPASPLQTNPFRATPQPQVTSRSQTPLPQPQNQQNRAPAPINPFAVPDQSDVQQQLARALAQNIEARAEAQLQLGRYVREPSTNPQGAHPTDPSPPPTGRSTALSGLVPPSLGPQNIPGRTVRQQGVGPNGERWSITYNEVNLPARAQLPVVLPQIGVPQGLIPPARPTGPPTHDDAVDRAFTTTELRMILDCARREMQNVRVLFQSPGSQQDRGSTGPPTWRLNRIREHIRTVNNDLDAIETGLTRLNDPTLAHTAEIVALRQAVNELRIQVGNMYQALTRAQSFPVVMQSQAITSTSAPRVAASLISNTGSGPLDSTLQAQASISDQTSPSATPPELFILSSPQGPVGVLFEQRGTFMTAPMVQTLPFQTFTEQFNQNRQLIASLGQQIVQRSSPLSNHQLNASQAQAPTSAQQTTPTNGGQEANQPHGQPQNRDQQQVRPQNQIVNGDANPAAENVGAADAPNDMANIAGHLWLIFKLACFVYFFAGGASIYRMSMLGLIAVLVYLAQVGVFESQFNMLRRHFEALLPDGALADQAAQPLNANGPQPRAGGLTPEQAAQRLLQQRRDQRFGWMREGMRALERSVALFAASLWPGVGERMVHAQEERLRLARVAESEERERQEEEARRQQAEVEQRKEEEKREQGQNSEMIEKGQNAVEEVGKEEEEEEEQARTLKGEEEEASASASSFTTTSTSSDPCPSEAS